MKIIIIVISVYGALTKINVKTIKKKINLRVFEKLLIHLLGNLVQCRAAAFIYLYGSGSMYFIDCGCHSHDLVPVYNKDIIIVYYVYSSLSLCYLKIFVGSFALATKRRSATISSDGVFIPCLL